MLIANPNICLRIMRHFPQWSTCFNSVNPIIEKTHSGIFTKALQVSLDVFLPATPDFCKRKLAVKRKNAHDEDDFKEYFNEYFKGYFKRYKEV